MSGDTTYAAGPPQPLSCTNTQIVGTLQRMTAGLIWPPGSGSRIQVLKWYNYRPNPDRRAAVAGPFEGNVRWRLWRARIARAVDPLLS